MGTMGGIYYSMVEMVPVVGDISEMEDYEVQ